MEGLRLKQHVFDACLSGKIPAPSKDQLSSVFISLLVSENSDRRVVTPPPQYRFDGPERGEGDVHEEERARGSGMKGDG